MNILIVRSDKLGDFITALPAIYLLKQFNPVNKIIVCIAALNRELAESCSFIDDVIVDDGKSILALAKKIKEKKIDSSVTLFSNTHVALAQLLAGVKVRVAPATKIAQIFYTKRVIQRRSEVKKAEFEYNIDLVETIFNPLKLEYAQPLLQFSDSKSIYKAFCKHHFINKEIIVFHIGFGGSSDANWSFDEYEILIRKVLEQDKHQVVMTFGPDEESLLKEMKSRLKKEKIIFHLSSEGIVSFAKFLSNVKLFISTSTGTYHLASLVGCRTMTFFAETLFASPKRWRGVGKFELQENYTIPSNDLQRKKLLTKIVEKLDTI